MEETRWWTRIFLLSAVISVVLLVVAPLGYKFEITGLQPSFLSLMLSLVVAIIVFLASVIMVVVAAKKGLTRNRNLTAIAIVVTLIPLGTMIPQILKGRSVPPIHDISTDTADPPQYDKVVALRVNALNSLEYGAGTSAEEHALIQTKAYPDVRTQESDLSVPDAVARASTVLAEQGLEVVNADPESGVVEAVATTFWFGFKDDVVVRVRAKDAGSTIDVRSVSRVGQSDVGANAARIMKFLNAF